MNNHRSKSSRTEPAFGSFGQFDGADEVEPRIPMGQAGPPHRQHRSSSMWRRWGWFLAAFIVILAAIGWSQRDSLRALLPQSHFTSLLERGDAALAAGKLDGTDGNSAREIYTAALVVQPGSARARAGLEKVGQAELARAHKALASGDLTTAAHSLKVARALLGGGDEMDKLDAKLAQQQARGQELDVLLQRASKALVEGRIDGGDGAGALYRQALVADPDNAIARHGLDKVGAALAARIRLAVNDGRLDDAEADLEKLHQWLPNSASLPQLRALMSDAQRSRNEAQKALLAAAADDLAAGRLAGSGENNALARYRKVLASDPDNAEAKAGVRKVAATLMGRARQRLADGELDKSHRLLQRADDAGASSRDVQKMREALAEAKIEHAAPPPLTTAQHRKVARLITRASAAAESGKLMLPPGESAYDMYRAALAIDPDNADAMAGLASLPGQTRRLFRKALRENDRARASQLIDVYAQLVPGSPTLDVMRNELTNTRWRGG